MKTEDEETDDTAVVLMPKGGADEIIVTEVRLVQSSKDWAMIIAANALAGAIGGIVVLLLS